MLNGTINANFGLANWCKINDYYDLDAQGYRTAKGSWKVLMRLFNLLSGYVLIMLGVILSIHFDFTIGVLVSAMVCLCFGQFANAFRSK